MELIFTRSFERDYRRLPRSVQARLDKRLFLLVANFFHPSLRTKRIKGHPHAWEGRITRSYRFTFQFEGEHCILRRAGTHDILATP